jgi:NAD(P)-dependent dehydrogenase (short-subunit alcohol dehydrogenase family)
MKLDLEDKTALVTGSTKGIGFAIALELAKEGARVILNGRSEGSVNSALDKIRQACPKAKVEGFAADLATEQGAEDLLKRFPQVDILINNLGIFEPKPFEEITDEEWRRFFEVNVLSGVRLSRAYVAQMKKRSWGRILFISSESAIQTPVEMMHYGMTKTAMLPISRGLAEYCAGTAVTVNAILPGPTHSEGVEDFVKQVSGGHSFKEFEKDFFKNVRPSSLIQRFATAEEVAVLVAFVCSPKAAAITGAALRVDGGVIRSCF